jgi:hypothetical protein
MIAKPSAKLRQSPYSVPIDIRYFWRKVASKVELTAAQCRAARALLNWPQADLEKAGMAAKKTIADFEREARTPCDRKFAAICAGLETAELSSSPRTAEALGSG